MYSRFYIGSKILDFALLVVSIEAAHPLCSPVRFVPQTNFRFFDDISGPKQSGLSRYIGCAINGYFDNRETQPIHNPSVFRSSPTLPPPSEPQQNLSAMASTDRDILLALYRSTNGPNWDNNTNWDTDVDVNLWYGVKLNDQGRVVKLALNFNSLVGTLADIAFYSLALTLVFPRFCWIILIRSLDGTTTSLFC